MNSIKLIPTPQTVKTTDGSFDLSKGVSVVLANPNRTADRFAAQQLVDEAKTDWSISLKLKKASRSNHILIGQVGQDALIDAAIAKLNLIKPLPGSTDAYVLHVSADQVVVAGYSEAGTFYGVQTLKQLVRQSKSLPCVDIVDWAALKYRGWQDDVSRGPIPTLDYLKRQVRTLSEFKLNTMTLYTEHVFKLKKHPTIAPKDGLTATEIKELVAYAKDYHIEVIGNFQSFGHFANILNVKGYANLGEAGWVLSPAKEESYAFLKDVYSEIAPTYTSTLFNINCDETGGLGEGASKELVQKIGLAGVYAQHINRIADLLRPLGKTALMWGDIAQQHPEIVPKLPKDLVVMSWGYHPGDNFDYAILPFTKLGLRFMVCPGVSCWSQMFPDYRSAAINISNYVRDGHRNGAMGMLNTTWDDDGENLFSYNWDPLIWGGECSWNPAFVLDGDWNAYREQRLSTYKDAFDSAFLGFADAKVSEALWKLADLRSNPASGGMSDGAFWQDLDTVARRRTSLENAQKLVVDAQAIVTTLEEAKTKAKHNADSLDFAIFAARRAKFMGERAVAVKLQDDAIDNPVIRSGVVTAINNLVNEAVELRAEYARLWRLENREWWLDRNLARYDDMIAKLKGAASGPTITPRQLTFQGTISVQLGTLNPSLEIRYTLDGSEPTASSTLYAKPFEISKTTQVKARSFLKGVETGGVVEATFRTTPIPATITTNMNPYEDHIALNAFDGDPETFFWREGPPQAGEWLQVTFAEPLKAKSIKVPTGHPDGGRDQLVHGVLEATEDGSTWNLSTEFQKGQAELNIEGKAIKAFRVRVTQNGSFWLVVREITVR